MTAPLPENEQARLAALLEYDILDTPFEDAFDDIANLAAALCETPIAAVTLVDSERQWFKSILGLDARETSRDAAFCAHTILQPDLFIIPDAHEDHRFVDNPLVTGVPHIRFYAGAPLITSDGFSVGSLCVIDRSPRKLSAHQETALRVLGRQVTAQLELRRYAMIVEKKMQELATANEKLEAANSKLEALATLDGLTGLKNHRAMQERLAEEVAHAQRYQTDLSVILLDVDHFKQYNDTFGHPAGDEVLKTVAKLIGTGAREADIVARYGGEEFALVLPGIDIAHASMAAERIRTAIAEHEWSDRPVTASFGVVGFSADANSPKQLLRLADDRLYQAKRAGRNRVVSTEG